MARIVWVSMLGLLGVMNSAFAAPTFSCTTASPSQAIDAANPGEIVNPGSPGPYTGKYDCTWTLKAPLASVVRVTITKLNLDGSDFLTVADGQTAFSGNIIGKYSLCMKGQLSLFSTGQYMLIKFKSDTSKSNEGFRIQYKSVRKSQILKAGKVNNVCLFNAIITTPMRGYVAHPGFPGPVNEYKRCNWQIKFNGKQPSISYKLLGLKADPGFCYDSQVRHSLGGNTAGHCGCTSFPKNERSTNNDAYIQSSVRSVSGVGQPGFLIYYNDVGPAECPDITKCAAMDDDRNVGFDRNSNILYEKKTVTTTPAPTTPPPTKKEPEKPFYVTCGKDKIEIALKTSEFGGGNFKTESATLRDTNCEAKRLNNTHVYMETPLDGCGTYHNYSSDGRYVIYYNYIVLQKNSTEDSALITRDHEAVFEFECLYHRRVVMSVVHYTPARATVFTATENFGNFTYMMRMFKSKEYKEAYDKYPVYVVASKDVFVQTEVIAKDADLVLLVEKCNVTPSKDRNDKEFYDLIEEGCSKDETLEYDHKLSSVQRFNFKAFYFNVDKQATVHIHCTVRVCRKADKNSRCVKGCPYSRRKRAAPNANEENEITGSLSLGPVSQLQNEAETGKSTASDSPKMFVEIVVGVLGFFVVVLLVAVTVVLLKKRRQPRKEGLSLMVDDIEH